MIRITADERIPFLKGVLEPFANVSYLPGNQINRNHLMESDALLIRTRTRCDSELLKGTPVKFIGTATIGFDHVDTNYCEKNNIKWVNAPGCNSTSVTQYITAALLRIASEADFHLKAKKIGIVGVGNVGSKVQNLANLLGMKVLLNDPPRARNEKKKSFIDLEDLLTESDIVTIHVPLNMSGQDRTFHLFDKETFTKFKKGAWIINSARGEVIETEVLKDALDREIITGAVIDVWEKEPEIDLQLMHMAFLATPHIAGYSSDGKANGTAMIVRELSKSFNFPLSNWYPVEIPASHEPVITIDCNGKSTEEILRKAVFHTYNIVEDDIRLRFDPARFEKMREIYPVRREFSHFTVSLRNSTEEIRKLLKNLGFKVTKG